MTDEDRYKTVLNMESVDQNTAGRYPTKAQFMEALADGMVAGDYVTRVIIVSTDPQQQYKFTQSI